MEPKYTCSLDECNDIKRMIERLPETDYVKLLKFENFMMSLEEDGYTCKDYTCLPLLQLLTKIGTSHS